MIKEVEGAVLALEILNVDERLTDLESRPVISGIRTGGSTSPSTGSGATAWGDITGTLSDQTDLQAALDAIGGGYSVVTVTGATHNETATEGEVVILCDTTSNSITVNLPTAVGNTAKFTIKKLITANTVTIDGNGSQTIDGGTTAVLNIRYEAITIISDNANWHII